MGASKSKPVDYVAMAGNQYGAKAFDQGQKMPKFDTTPPKIDYKTSGSGTSARDIAGTLARGLAPIAGGQRKAGDTFDEANRRNYERLIGGGGGVSDTGEGVSVIQPGAPMVPVMFGQQQGGQEEKSTGQRIAGGLVGGLGGFATGGPIGAAAGALGGFFG